MCAICWPGQPADLTSDGSLLVFAQDQRGSAGAGGRSRSKGRTRENASPQGRKPHTLATASGTAEAAPFQSGT